MNQPQIPALSANAANVEANKMSGYKPSNLSTDIVTSAKTR